MNIGDRIKSLREERKITQTELADMIGTTKQNIYKYENGIITNIPSDKVELIAQKLDVSPAYIMGWDDKKETAPADESKNGLNKILNVFSSDEVDELSSLSRDKANEVLDLIRKTPEE